MLELTKQLIVTPEEFDDFNQVEEDWENEETPTVCHEVLDFYRQVVANMALFNEDGAEGAKRDFYAAWFQSNDDEDVPQALGGDIEEGEMTFRLAYAKTADDLGLEMAFVELSDTLCPWDNLGHNQRTELEEIFF